MSEEEEPWPDAMSKVVNLQHWAYFFSPEEDRAKQDAWMVNGKCFKKSDLVDIFNPPSDEDGDEETSPHTARVITIAAKKYCKGTEDGAKCSALKQCLEYALENRIYSGVWGATTARERRRIAASRNAQESKRQQSTDGSKKG